MPSGRLAGRRAGYPAEMASDGDRHLLGDPVTRALRADEAPSLLDRRPPEDLTEAELRRELTNLDMIVRESATRGIQPDTLAVAEGRREELSAEYDRRFSGNGLT
jgi:hypothetical protein